MIFKPKEQTSRIAKNIELIGDIVSAEMKLKKIDIFEQGLEVLQNTLKKLFALRKTDIHKFQKLMLIKQVHYGKEVFVPADNFKAILNQLFRIYISSVDSQNASIIYQTKYILWDCFRLCLKDYDDSKDSGFKDQFYQQILYINYHEKNDTVRSELAESFPRFYNSTVNIIGDCPVVALETLNSLMFNFVVKEYTNEKLLDEIKDWLPNGLFGNYDLDEFWKYKTTENKKEWDSIYKGISLIYSYQDFIFWKEGFSNFSEKNSMSSETSIKIIDAGVERYRSQVLQQLFYKIECFYLSKNQYKFIKKLWEINQPLGSDITILSSPIRPDRLELLLLLYSRHLEKDVLHDSVYFNEVFAHEKWVKEYFILQLLKLIYENKVEMLSFQNFETYMLRNLLYIKKKFNNAIQSIKENNELLSILFPSLNVEAKSIDLNPSYGSSLFEINATGSENDLFDELNLFLENLVEQCSVEINQREINAPLSEEKILEFKNNFLTSYTSALKITDIINVEDDFSKIPDAGVLFFGFRRFFPKDIFIEDANVFYSPSDIGHKFALSENSSIYTLISKNCKKEIDSSFIELLKSMRDPVILATYRGIYHFIERFSETKKSLSSKGTYIGLDKGDIPVHFVMMTPDDRVVEGLPCMVVFERDSIGSLHRYNPILEGDSEKDRLEHFVLDIKDGKLESTELKETVNKPEWYQELIAQGKDPEEFLMEHVLIKLEERFEFKPANETIAYSFFMDLENE